MSQVRSRVNGLIITIPTDARGVIHRFAIGGGGNELVFEPIKKNDYNQSIKMDAKPVAMGGPSEEEDPEVPSETGSVELTLNLADDSPEPEVAKPRKGRSKKATASEAELNDLV